MAYRDQRFVKRHDVKIRLDENDIDRLDRYLERFGGERAVIARDAIIQFLDDADVRYRDPQLNIMLEERQHINRVKRGVRSLNEQLDQTKTKTA